MAPLQTQVDPEKMALYKLDRAHCAMAALAEKQRWEPQDTSSFDCMHYLGNEALDHAATRLGLKPTDKLIDVGSGFSATGRYLHKKLGIDVTGVELQSAVHEVAEVITRKNGMEANVRSINGDFSTVDLDGPVDHIVSFLCITHIPDRAPVFDKAIRLLKPGGKLYIEDLYVRTALDDASRALVTDVLQSPALPTREQYISELEVAGFEDTEFVDMSDIWASFVRDRSIAYRANPDCENTLLGFYDAVSSLFESGRLGGARILCTSKPNSPSVAYEVET